MAEIILGALIFAIGTLFGAGISASKDKKNDD